MTLNDRPSPPPSASIRSTQGRCARAHARTRVVDGATIVSIKVRHFHFVGKEKRELTVACRWTRMIGVGGKGRGANGEHRENARKVLLRACARICGGVGRRRPLTNGRGELARSAGDRPRFRSHGRRRRGRLPLPGAHRARRCKLRGVDHRFDSNVRPAVRSDSLAGAATVVL